MLLYVVFISVVLQSVACDMESAATGETVIVETTTEQEIEHIDIAEEEVEAALNLDYGVYTTMKFRYINSQYDNTKQVDKCQNDYIKCLTSQGVATPVCAYNWFDDIPKSDGFFLADSYCDVYFDNCRRNMRFWRILNYGACKYLTYEDVYLDMPMTLRKFYKMSSKFISKIANMVKRNSNST